VITPLAVAPTFLAVQVGAVSEDGGEEFHACVATQPPPTTPPHPPDAVLVPLEAALRDFFAWCGPRRQWDSGQLPLLPLHVAAQQDAAGAAQQPCEPLPGSNRSRRGAPSRCLAVHRRRHGPDAPPQRLVLALHNGAASSLLPALLISAGTVGVSPPGRNTPRHRAARPLHPCTQQGGLFSGLMSLALLHVLG
jgi:hypothetical protein